MMIIKKVLFIFFLLFPFFLNAKTTDDYLNESKMGICKKMIEQEGEISVYECAYLMVKESDKKLNKRLSERTLELVKINDNDIIKAFKKHQRSWERYKKDRCTYVTSGTEKDSTAYQFHLNLCNATENYRRIETLEDEPGFP
ncbi:lysozyme inhibitor LprI family protein [Pectobacterium carotovorum]|uniref:lysozyme inhibitor LprI family protein n=1 Tax=Pectobacterium carotovorum TaxID=554 RepID=UPI001EFA5C62|nr:lysozyme inhibitor LprI family protein [Pectobacterium carotovorum]ULS49203.1 DUF1311 domain-containing protein [Pectobacterium carotovorum]